MTLRPLLTIASVLALSGCVASAVGADDAPASTFLLPTETVVSEPSQANGPQILVAEPLTLDVLSSPRVVVRVGPREVQYLSNARYGDALTRLTQFKIKRALESANGIGAVSVPGEGLAIDYQILTDIRAFEIRAGAPDTAFVALSIKLLNDRNGNVVASRVFRGVADVPLVADEAVNEAYIAALDIALANALEELRGWVVART